MGRVLLLMLMIGACVGKKRPSPLPWRASREAKTTQGSVRGYLGSRHYAFLGIPYARPPTATDRFKAPEPPPTWDSIFEATHRVKCPQPSGDGDENCLVVNVFVPQGAQECCPVSVLVYIHDGGFHSGYGSLQPPEVFRDDYVVVTFNYRLGALGFLCLGTPEAPGNAGLKDQVAVLYWIHLNIASFRGNPEDVTLYGTGSGSTSIQLLILSGLSKGLFHKVILESGSVLSPTSLSYNPYATALNTAVKLGYNDEGDTGMLLQFYQTLPLLNLVKLSSNFLPCIESRSLYAYSLISEDPIKILKDGNFDKVPMMVMYTNAHELDVIEENPNRFTSFPEYFEGLLPSNLEFDSEESKYKIADLVRDFYFDNIDSERKVVENYKDYINDIFMEYPVNKMATLYASKSTIPVFVMTFMYNSHGKGDDDSVYGDVFEYISVQHDKNDGRQKVAQKLMSLMNNFIKIGDPTPLTSELIPVIWDPINPQGQEMLSVTRPCLLFRKTLTMGMPPASERLNFWDRIYSKYYRKYNFDAD